MTKKGFDAMVAEMEETEKMNYNRAILAQRKNVWKVIFKGKSNSNDTLEIYTTATSPNIAVKKVLDTLYANKEKYKHIFVHYAVYPFNFEKTSEYKQLDERGKWFWGEKHPIALLVTGVDKLFIA